MQAENEVLRCEVQGLTPQAGETAHVIAALLDRRVPDAEACWRALWGVNGVHVCHRRNAAMQKLSEAEVAPFVWNSGGLDG